MPKNIVWAKLTMPVYPSSRSKLATSTMNTRILAATFSAFTPGIRKGAPASASSSSTSTTASTRLRGRSLESRRVGMPRLSVQGVHALRPPQQDRHHQQDVRKERRLGQEETRVVGHQPHEQGADQRARGGTESPDDQDDEDQDVDLRPHLRHHVL